MKKRIISLSLALLMVLSLAACAGDADLESVANSLTTKDASDCVQVEMDTTYKGDFSGFLDFYSNVTREDAQNQYDANIEGETLFFLYSLGPTSLEDENSSVEPTEMQLHNAKELYKQIYAKSDYSIVSSSEQDDGTFAVKVTVKPLNLLTVVEQKYDEYFDPFWEKFDAAIESDTVEAMSDEEFAEWYVDVYSKEYYDTLIKLLDAAIPELDYKAEKSIVIQVQQDEEGLLFISSEDLQNLDNLIIDYTVEEE